MKQQLPHHNGATKLCEPAVAARRFSWALASCCDKRLRMTAAREHILRYLAGHAEPVSWEMLTRAEELRSRCDPATIYRTLALLKDMDVVRQVSLPHKTSFFALNKPGDNDAYLICRRCGSVVELPLPSSATQTIQQVAEAKGFSWPYHELDFHGLCRDCQIAKKKETPANKLRVRG